MKPKKCFLSLFISFILMFPSIPLFAADAFLDNCLKIAEARSKKLAVAAEQINLSNTKIFGSGRQFFPSLAFQRKYTKGNTINAEYQSEEIAFKAIQPIYEGGKLRATYSHDVFMLAAARYNYTKTREDLFAAVKVAYYELLSYKMQLNALTAAFEDIEKLHAKVIKEYKAKAISELDLIESENFRDKVSDMLENTKDDIALAEKKLVVLLNIDKIEDIPIPMPENLQDEVQEISFSLNDCVDLAKLNNIDVVSSQIQIKIADEKKKVVRSRIIPNLSVEGSYGQGGEAFVTQPLDLSTIWSVMGKMNWGLWGNSLEVSQTSEKTEPKQITDPTAKIEANTSDIKFSILDDFNYFIQNKETSVSQDQAKADFLESINKTIIDVQKNYNEYRSSLRDTRTYRNEIVVKKRKLAFLKRRNDLYEIPTVQVMEESWKYAEVIASYAKALHKNYSAVAELERLTLVPMR